MTDTGPEEPANDEAQAHPLEAPKAQDQIHQQFVDKGQLIARDQTDGMPRPAAPYSVESAQAPWPHEQNFVCMGDLSSFVLRESTFWEVVATFKPEEVTRAASGIYIVPTDLAAARCPEDVIREAALLALKQNEDIAAMREELKAQQQQQGRAGAVPPAPPPFLGGKGRYVPLGEDDGSLEDRVITPIDIVLMALAKHHRGEKGMIVATPRLPVVHNPGMLVGARSDPLLTTGWVEVEPVRPQCAHYARQLPDFPQEPDANLGIRVCTARRVDYGDFLSLNDGLMLGCDMRAPPIGNNAATLDKWEKDVVERGKATTKKRAALDDEQDDEEHFDASAELAAEQSGIFGRDE